MPLLRRYAVLIVATLLPAAFFAVMHGLPQRNRAVDELEMAGQHLYSDPCLGIVMQYHPRLTPPCVQPGNGPAVALIGDSHAAAISEAMRAIVNKAGYRFVESTKSGCEVMEGVSVRGVTPQRGKSCTAFNRDRLDYVVHDPTIQIVIVAQCWSLPFRQANLGDSYVADGKDGIPPTEQEKWDLFRLGLTKMVDRLETSGKTVYLLLDNPAFGFDPMRHMRTHLILPRRFVASLVADSSLSYANGIAPDSYLPEDRQARQIVTEVAAAHPKVRLIDMRKQLCTPDGCRFALGDQALYGDWGHLFALGAQIALTDLHLPQLQPSASK
jgi:hypothetical protein